MFDPFRVGDTRLEAACTVSGATRVLLRLDDLYGEWLSDGWQRATGAWEQPAGPTYGSYLMQTDNEAFARWFSTVPAGYQVVSTRVRPQSFGTANDPWIGLAARVIDESNYYYLTLRRSQQLSLRRLVNEADTLALGDRLTLLKGLIPSVAREMAPRDFEGFIHELRLKGERFYDATLHPGLGRAHRRVIGEALQEPAWLTLDDEQRARRLEEALERRESPVGDLSSEGRRTLAVFQTIAHCRRKYGRESIGPYIVSMAHGPDDVLSVLLLAKWGHLGPKGEAVPLDIAPLFETGEDVERAPKIIERLLNDKLYREHLRSRGDHQIVMLGYSDTYRDGGIAAARWSLQKAQQALVATMERHGVALTVFHGRGGTMSRSGGALHEAVLAAPRGAIAGRLRMTEQGENITTKYGLRGIALRTFEQILSAVLLVTVHPPAQSPAEARWHSIMEEIAVASRGAYQSLLSDPDDFMEYFRAATPIDVIERIGSRSERAEHVSESVSEPRAAPWVFAWTQSRCLLPSWYGVAAGLKKAIDVHGEDVLVEMFEQWHFFRVLLSDVATALAKADLDVAARYSRLAGDRHDKFFPAIRREFKACVDLILRLTRQNELLEASRTLRRAIRLRSPYVDPMSFLQVDMLERWRADGRPDGPVLQALTASINGIAHAMQGTG